MKSNTIWDAICKMLIWRSSPLRNSTNEKIANELAWLGGKLCLRNSPLFKIKKINDFVWIFFSEQRQENHIIYIEHSTLNNSSYRLCLLFNPWRKTASIPPQINGRNGLSSLIGFFKELSNSKTPSEEKKHPGFELSCSGREVLREAKHIFTFTFQMA